VIITVGLGKIRLPRVTGFGSTFPDIDLTERNWLCKKKRGTPML